MEKFQLSLAFTLTGIGAASGLIYIDKRLYLISDGSSYLYEYSIADAQLNKIALVENPQENIAKKDKPDFESITFSNNKLYLFGSGSTQKRESRFTFNLESKKIKERNLSKIYKRLKETISLPDDELNIEGIIITETTTYFFQRGNGVNAQNGVFIFKRNGNDNINDNINGNINDKIQFIAFELPKIKNVSTTFTDAILVENTIYFLAAAEDTASTYEDGEVLGSVIGTIDLKTMSLESCIQISDKHKFEGLTLYNKTATQIELLLCEDNDTEELESTIYKLALYYGEKLN